MRNLGGLLALLATLAAASCSSKPAATCENVGAHIKEIMLSSDQLKKAPADQIKTASALVENWQTEVTKECMDKKWDAAEIECILAAKKTDDMEKCQAKK